MRLLRNLFKALCRFYVFLSALHNNENEKKIYIKKSCREKNKKLIL